MHCKEWIDTGKKWYKWLHEMKASFLGLLFFKWHTIRIIYQHLLIMIIFFTIRKYDIKVQYLYDMLVAQSILSNRELRVLESMLLFLEDVIKRLCKNLTWFCSCFKFVKKIEDFWMIKKWILYSYIFFFVITI